EEVVVEKKDAGKDVSDVEEINAASIATSVAAKTPTISMDEITLAKALIKIKTSRPKAKGIVMQELSETPTPTPIVSSQQPSKTTGLCDSRIHHMMDPSRVFGGSVGGAGITFVIL
nr:hypothetical protein [Tanacetum cinerariifolium]